MIYHTYICTSVYNISTVLGVIPGSIQLIPGSYKNDKPFNFTDRDKVHLKCDCIDENIVNGIREPSLYSFGLTLPSGHKIHNQPRVKLFK